MIGFLSCPHFLLGHLPGMMIGFLTSLLFRSPAKNDDRIPILSSLSFWVPAKNDGRIPDLNFFIRYPPRMMIGFHILLKKVKSGILSSFFFGGVTPQKKWSLASGFLSSVVRTNQKWHKIKWLLTYFLVNPPRMMMGFHISLSFWIVLCSSVTRQKWR